VVESERDQASRRARSCPPEPGPQPGGRRRGPAPVWQDDPRSRARAGRFAQLLRPRGPAQPQPPGAAADGPLAPPGNHRDRRGAETARPVPRPSGPGRPPAATGAIPRPGQCLARPAPPVRGVARRPDRGRLALRLLAGRGRDERARSAVAAGRLSARLSRSLPRRQLCLAAGPGANVPRARSARAGDHDPGGRAATLLEHAGPLPRRHLERGGVRAVPRSQRADGETVPGSAERAVHGARAAALAREHRQAAGEIPQGLRPGQRAAAPAAGFEDRGRAAAPPAVRGFLGGLRHRGDPEGGAARGRLLLGHPHGGRARPPPAQGRAAARRGGEEGRRSAADAIDARGARRPSARAARRALPGRDELRARRACHGASPRDGVRGGQGALPRPSRSPRSPRPRRRPAY
jgi:hypothetical protein